MRLYFYKRIIKFIMYFKVMMVVLLNIKILEIFYYIMKEDNDFEIMCELGYNKSNKICGYGRFNLIFFIEI